MTMLKETKEFRVVSESDALELIEEEKSKAAHEGYAILKAAYDYKSKKAKGEIVDEGYRVCITYQYSTFWGD